MAKSNSSKPANKPASKPEGETRTSFQYPYLHEDVAQAVSPELTSTWFNKKGSKESCNNEHSTNVMGVFRCNKEGCSKGSWRSGTVAILIRGYPKNGYDATVFNQQCESCKGLGTLRLDRQSYIDRVAYRLKKWAGVQTEHPPYTEKPQQPPHKEELCEGCKRGHCLKRKALYGRTVRHVGSEGES